jgi:hypothetical protein
MEIACIISWGGMAKTDNNVLLLILLVFFWKIDISWVYGNIIWLYAHMEVTCPSLLCSSECTCDHILITECKWKSIKHLLLYLFSLSYWHILIIQRGFIVIFPYMPVMYFDQIHPSVVILYKNLLVSQFLILFLQSVFKTWSWYACFYYADDATLRKLLNKNTEDTRSPGQLVKKTKYLTSSGPHTSLKGTNYFIWARHIWVCCSSLVLF